MKKCGYKGWALNQSIRPTLFDIPKNQNKSLRGYVSVPYVQGISESFKRLLTSSTDCSVAFKGYKTIRDHLVHPKDQDEIGSKTNVIYKICCKECSSIYIGQTKRRLKDRIKEHIKSVVAGVGVSGVANHVLNTSHSIDWDNVTILDGESNKLAREIKESIWIRKCNPELNRKGGFVVNRIQQREHLMETQNEAFHPYVSVRRPSDGRRWCPKWLGFATHRNFQVGGGLNYGILIQSYRVVKADLCK